MANCRCRCSRGKCRVRITLKKPLHEYVRKPKCKVCGGSLTVDAHRQSHKEAGKDTCYCDGLHYPHRRGSVVWCHEHSTGPTEQDQIDRYGDQSYE